MADIGDSRVQPALEAMLIGDPVSLQAAIDRDPEVVAIRWGENTLLEWLTQPPGPPSLEIAGVLIANGAALDRALNLAGCWDLAALCRQLLDAGADPAARADAGITPLESAAMHGAAGAADVLVTAGLHRPSLWLAAAAGLRDEVTAWVGAEGELLGDPGTYRPRLSDVGHPSSPEPGDDPRSVVAEAVVFAGANGRMSVVDDLLGMGFSVDERLSSNITALHLAILFRNPDAVRGLLERGAATNVHDDWYSSDAKGWAGACLNDDPRSHAVADLLAAG